MKSSRGFGSLPNAEIDDCRLSLPDDGGRARRSAKFKVKTKQTLHVAKSARIFLRQLHNLCSLIMLHVNNFNGKIKNICYVMDTQYKFMCNNFPTYPLNWIRQRRVTARDFRCRKTERNAISPNCSEDDDEWRWVCCTIYIRHPQHHLRRAIMSWCFALGCGNEKFSASQCSGKAFSLCRDSFVPHSEYKAVTELGNMGIRRRQVGGTGWIAANLKPLNKAYGLRRFAYTKSVWIALQTQTVLYCDKEHAGALQV